MTSSLLVQDQTQKRLALRHHRFVTIATAVKKRVAQCAGEITKHLWISEGWWYIDFFQVLQAPSFCSFPIGLIDSRTFLHATIPTWMWYFCLLLFSTPVLLYFRFEWSAYDGACLSICDSVGVMAGKFGDRFWPPSNCCHRSHLSGRNVNDSNCGAKKLQTNHFADPIGAMNETWKSLIRRQSYSNSGFVSLPTGRVDSVDGEMMVMTSCVLVRWTRTQLPCRNAPQIYFLSGVPFCSSKGFFLGNLRLTVWIVSRVTSKMGTFLCQLQFGADAKVPTDASPPPNSASFERILKASNLSTTHAAGQLRKIEVTCLGDLSQELFVQWDRRNAWIRMSSCEQGSCLCNTAICSFRLELEAKPEKKLAQP